MGHLSKRKRLLKSLNLKRKLQRLNRNLASEVLKNASNAIVLMRSAPTNNKLSNVATESNPSKANEENIVPSNEPLTEIDQVIHYLQYICQFSTRGLDVDCFSSFLCLITFYYYYANRRWHIGISVCSEFFDLNDNFYIYLDLFITVDD